MLSPQRYLKIIAVPHEDIHNLSKQEIDAIAEAVIILKFHTMQEFDIIVYRVGIIYSIGIYSAVEKILFGH